MRPALPKNWALAFSRSAGVALCANKAVALATKESNSFISTLENKQGLVPFQALALAVIAQEAIKTIASYRDLKQPAWP
jgi:hypothetical protein